MSQPIAIELAVVLRTLQALGLKAWSEGSVSSLPPRDPNFKVLVQKAAPERALQALPESGLASVTGHCIRLPVRIIKGVLWVPLLWIANHPMGGHQIQLVVTGQGKPFGYRWEPPEGGILGKGPHDYWHAQPITSVRVSVASELPLGIADGDICTGLPTFPIDAPDQLALLDALLVSTYGPRYLELYVPDAWLRNQIQKLTSDRSWAKLRAPLGASTASIGTKGNTTKKKK
jgi:hypothetical protein